MTCRFFLILERIIRSCLWKWRNNFGREEDEGEILLGDEKYPLYWNYLQLLKSKRINRDIRSICACFSIPCFLSITFFIRWIDKRSSRSSYIVAVKAQSHYFFSTAAIWAFRFSISFFCLFVSRLLSLMFCWWYSTIKYRSFTLKPLKWEERTGKKQSVIYLRCSLAFFAS